MDRNFLAASLAMILPLHISLLLFGRVTSSKGAMALIYGVGSLGAISAFAILILTQSRGAYLGVAVALLTLAVLRCRGLAILALLLLLILLLGAGRLGLPTTMNLLLSSETLRGWQGRQEVWSRAIYMIQDFPYTGIGLGTFRRVAPLMYPFFLLGPDAFPVHTHNLWLQVGVDMGVPGLVAYVAFYTGILAMAWRAQRKFQIRGDSNLRAISLGLLAGLVAMGVHGLLDVALGWVIPAPAYPLVVPWWLMGYVAGLYRLSGEAVRSHGGKSWGPS
jgi:putative inorganic carbon (HCO3(-)) transporter